MIVRIFLLTRDTYGRKIKLRILNVIDDLNSSIVNIEYPNVVEIRKCVKIYQSHNIFLRIFSFSIVSHRTCFLIYVCTDTMIGR